MNVEVTVDRNMPSHAIFVTAPSCEDVRITMAANVEPDVLATLRPETGLAVEDTIDTREES
jgi:hypothetical protein